MTQNLQQSLSNHILRRRVSIFCGQKLETEFSIPGSIEFDLKEFSSFMVFHSNLELWRNELELLVFFKSQHETKLSMKCVLLQQYELKRDNIFTAQSPSDGRVNSLYVKYREKNFGIEIQSLEFNINLITTFSLFMCVHAIV